MTSRYSVWSIMLILILVLICLERDLSGSGVQAVKIFPPLHPMLVPLGGTFRLTCSDGHAPNWTREGLRSLQRTDSTLASEVIRDGDHGFSVRHTIGSTRSELVKTNVTLDDDALYVCTARNEKESDKKSFHMQDVVVLNTSATATHADNGEIMLACAGFPSRRLLADKSLLKLNCSWFSENRPVLHSDDQLTVYRQTDITQTLTIRPDRTRVAKGAGAEHWKEFECRCVGPHAQNFSRFLNISLDDNASSLPEFRTALQTVHADKLSTADKSTTLGDGDRKLPLSVGASEATLSTILLSVIVSVFFRSIAGS